VRACDFDPDTWLWTLRRQTTPGPGGLIDKGTNGKRARSVPLIEEVRPMVAARLLAASRPDDRLFTGPKGGQISTAVLRDATHWDDVVRAPRRAARRCEPCDRPRLGESDDPRSQHPELSVRPLVGRQEGCLNDAGYDEDLFFAATAMHALGLGEHASGEARFEVEGADLAAAVLK
jgi:hypothetical protein